MVHRLMLLLIPIVFVFAPSVSAQEDPNVVVMKKLFTKLGSIMGVGSNDTDDTFLVLANPGTLIDPTLDLSKVADQYQLSRVLDKVMSPSWIYRPTNKQTLPLYKMILDFKETPAKSVSPAQQALLTAARGRLFGPNNQHTPGFTNYRAAKKRLAQALDSCNAYLRTHPGEVLSNVLAAELDEAHQDYNLANTHPIGGTYAADEETINSLGHLDPAVWWAQLQTQLLLNTGNYNGTQFARYNLYPSYAEWSNPARQWTTISLRQADLEQTTSSSHTSVGGGFSAGWGLWSVGADYSHQENRTFFKLDLSGYTLSFEAMRVELDRPWMNDFVFHSRAWRWLNSAPLGTADKNISDGGDAAHGQTPKGLMPFLPTALLVARNVTLTGGWSADLKTTFDSQTSAGGSIGWGPFSFGGRTNSSDSSTYTKANVVGNTITFGSPQILGYFVEVLPPTPFPDPTLNWPQMTPALTAPVASTPTTDPLLKRAQELLRQVRAKSGTR